MKKYKISKELMNDIDRWNNSLDGWVWRDDVDSPLPFEVQMWWVDEPGTTTERNNRLIALIRYVNGEDVFEVEKPKKWIVRSKIRDRHRNYQYLTIYDEDNNQLTHFTDDAHHTSQSIFVNNAFKFNTKEEAEQFVNPLMEVVEWEE